VDSAVDSIFNKVFFRLNHACFKMIHVGCNIFSLGNIKQEKQAGGEDDNDK
jgi:hypothetical protein